MGLQQSREGQNPSPAAQDLPQGGRACLLAGLALLREEPAAQAGPAGPARPARKLRS